MINSIKIVKKLLRFLPSRGRNERESSLHGGTLCRARPGKSLLLANESARYGSAITKLSSGPISVRWLLGKLATDSRKIEICSAPTDLPLGIITDEAAGENEPVAVELLGAIAGSIPAVAAAPIAAGVPVYGAAGGKGQSPPGTPGQYYRIGTSLTAASLAGDLLQIVTCVPQIETIESEL